MEDIKIHDQIPIERYLLAYCMQNNSFMGVMQKWGVEAKLFQSQQAREVYGEELELYMQERPFNFATLKMRLPECSDYIVSLASETFDAIKGSFYFMEYGEDFVVEFVGDSYELIIEQLTKKGLFESDNQQECLKEIAAMREERDMKLKGGSSGALYEFAEESANDYKERVESRENGGIVSVSSGIPQFDSIIGGGFRKSHLTIIGGRPGMGKTAVGLHFALTAAGQGHHVRFYSLEMSGKELFERALCALSDIDSYRFRMGIRSSYDEEQLNIGLGKSFIPLFINDSPSLSVEGIRRDAISRSNGRCDMIVVDYLQLLANSEGINRNYNREQEVARIARELKNMAKELDVPVVALCQLSRLVETRGDKRPQLSDLRDSGEIEQAADEVIFVYRPGYYDKSNDERRIELIVAKNRHGRTGDVNCYHNVNMTKFSTEPI